MRPSSLCLDASVRHPRPQDISLRHDLAGSVGTAGLGVDAKHGASVRTLAKHSLPEWSSPLWLDCPSSWQTVMKWTSKRHVQSHKNLCTTYATCLKSLFAALGTLQWYPVEKNAFHPLVESLCILSTRFDKDLIDDLRPISHPEAM